MATIDELLLPFAQAICAKARALKLELTQSQRARILEAISDDIKKCSNFITPEVSHAAHEAAAQLKVDLRSKNWHDQDQFDCGRRIFHFEHMVPVSAIRRACVEECTEAAVLDILKSRLKVAWILKNEDAELRRLGYQTNRDDPEGAYRHAKIDLISER